MRLLRQSNLSGRVFENLEDIFMTSQFFIEIISLAYKKGQFPRSKEKKRTRKLDQLCRASK